MQTVLVIEVQRLGVQPLRQVHEQLGAVSPRLCLQQAQGNVAFSELSLQRDQVAAPEVDLDGCIVVRTPVVRRGDIHSNHLSLLAGMPERVVVVQPQVAAQPAQMQGAAHG